MRFCVWLLFLGLTLEASAGAAASKVIYGLQETVLIRELGINLPAKLDTGATTASLSARFIKIFEREGQPMVQFDLAVESEDRDALGIGRAQWDDIELPLAGYVRIKQRAESLQNQERVYRRRPVVMLTVCMGLRQQQIEVNLTNRSDFRFPVLIGAQALQKLSAVVDPAVQGVAGAPGCDNAPERVETEHNMEAAKAQ